MSRESTLAPSAFLNESQQRHLVVSCQYVDKLLAEIEQIVLASSSRSLFPRHIATLTAIQKKVLSDYLARIRDRLLTVLDSQNLHPPSPRGEDVFAIRTTLTFIEVAIEELKPKYMRGYGDVPETLVPQLDGIVDELATIVQKLAESLAADPARDLQARLARRDTAARTPAGVRHRAAQFRQRPPRLADRCRSARPAPTRRCGVCRYARSGIPCSRWSGADDGVPATV